MNHENQESSARLLFNRRVMTVLFLSFSSTLPLVLLTGTLQAWYTAAGVSLMVIGSLSLLQYAYLVKFVWAPFMDRYAPLGLGRRRSWILLTQISLAGALAVMAFMNPAYHPWELFWLSAVVAFISASQDVVIDGYRVDVLRQKERGFGVAVTTVGGRMAMLVGGGLALILAADYGWRATYLTMALLMLIQIIPTLTAPNPEKPVYPPVTLHAAVVAPFRELLTRKHIVMILLLVLIYKFGDALALALNTTFLMRGVGFTLLELGYSYKLTSVIASLLGGFAGGFFMPRLGLYRSLMVFGFLQTVTNLSFMVLALVGKNFPVMIGSIFSDYFCGGLSTAAFVAFLIALCKREYSATQYAILSALMAVSRVVIGPVAAYLVKHMGWAPFYLITFFAGFPALLILRWLRDRIDFSADTLHLKGNPSQKPSPRRVAI
ncbi:AmpG family muropeptide MFS transporter [Coxiella burnetii]|uniref:AmpG n=1 Tax=Coxiella burnetii (strain RSA 493 / Nine Mile phase I) TaxID=227377 RepID=Q83EW3_COXBU|nr:MFS transporter [Coxiella burnetii]NP_819241.1 muropeptide transporter [Coxiella burnetii RSA 493]AAO89755.1 AmpG [Coxiella burnetii RSA 493]ABX78867.1 AmpG protein [Coxiella burnetii RSA 331]ACJ19079.1 AmpG [Coxiella burnetii CbuG_Q212]ACJ19675.1 AmpG [Coxiella burnetii CbuK_Q154]AML47863.1 MFS transporter [Coxiella burnetii]